MLHFSNKQKGIVHPQLLIFVAVIGLLAFLFITSTASFKDSLFGLLYPKPESKAASSSEFYFGAFEDFGKQSDDTLFETSINDLRAHNLEAILFTNGFSEEQATRLNVSDRLNFPVIISPMGSLYDPWYHNNALQPTIENARNIMYPIIDRLKNHSSVIGYNLADDAGRQDLQNFQQKQILAIQAAQERDTGRPATSVLTPAYEWVYSDSQTKSMIHYYYPAIQGNADCNFYATVGNTQGGGYYGNSGANSYIGGINLARIRRDQKDPNHPFWFIPQTHGATRQTGVGGDFLRYPTPEEVRLENWLALGEGVDGIFWFVYSTVEGVPGIGFRDNPPLYTEVSDLGRRVKTFKSTVATTIPVDDQYTVTGPASIPFVHKPYIRTHKNLADGKYYVIVANKSCSAQNITINSSSLGGQLKDVENPSQVYGMGQSISLRGGDGKFLEVVNPGTFQPFTPPNLVQNPSFENGSTTPTDWQPTSGLTVSRDTTTARPGSGTASLRVQGSADGFIYQSYNIKSDTVYSFSFWVKLQNVMGEGVGGKYTETSPLSGANRNAPWRVNGTSDWKKVKYVFYTPNNDAGQNSSGRFDLQFNMTGGTAWIDDVKFCEGISCGTEPVNYQNPSGNPQPTPVITPAPTAIPTTPPVTGLRPMPTTPPPYGGTSVETWWNTHPFNPEVPNSIPIGGIVSPSNVVNLSPGADLVQAIYSNPNGTTFRFAPGTYVIKSTPNLYWLVWARKDLHFIADQPNTVTIDYSQGQLWWYGCSGAVMGTQETPNSTFGYIPVLNQKLNQRDPATLQCINNRPGNIYFKNLIFDGKGVQDSAPIHMLTYNGVVFDNVTFKGQKNLRAIDPNAFHHGHFDGASWDDNIWIRGSHFQGEAPVVTYLDGCASCGMIWNDINMSYRESSGAGSGGFGFWNNNDTSFDRNGNGKIDDETSETRKTQYVVAYGNTYNAGTVNAMAAQAEGFFANGSHILFARNKFTAPIYWMSRWMAEADNHNPNTPETFRDYIVRENLSTSNVLAVFRPDGGCYGGDIANNTCDMRGFNVVGNVALGGYQLLINYNTPVVPGTESNNCSGAGCPLPPAAVPYSSTPGTPGPTAVPTPVPTAGPTTPPGGVPQPSITKNVSCLSGPSAGTSIVTISWSGSGVNYTDISPDNFVNIFNKLVTGSNTTPGPVGFSKYPEGTPNLTLNPNITYSVRNYSSALNTHSATTTFSLPLCGTATPAPTAIPTAAPTSGGLDTQAPSIPTNVQATSITPTRVDITWNASTDNVGVSGYYVIRDGATLTNVTSGTSYTDLTVTPVNTYAYQVLAYDAAQNASAKSNFANVTTLSLLQGDVDRNGVCNIFDYNIVMRDYGKTGTGIQGDTDGNGVVNIFDYNIIFRDYGK